jgi:hypothetical protein
MIERITQHQLFVILPLFFFIQAGLNDLYAQEDQRAITSDLQKLDSLIARDSLTNINRENLERIESSATPEIPASIMADSTAVTLPTLNYTWVPDPFKATWLAVVFPGGGQIYNRKYWKLPLIYAGFAGCLYGFNWNSNIYKDYSKAYIDIMDDNPNTNSFLEMLPSDAASRYDETYMKDLLRKRKDMYRRYRDMTIFALIGVYFISLVDAYVDAELSDFDISPDLSLRISPTLINDKRLSGSSFGLQCSFTF